MVTRNCLIFVNTLATHHTVLRSHINKCLMTRPLANMVIFSVELNYRSMSQPCYIRFLFIRIHAIRNRQYTVILLH